MKSNPVRTLCVILLVNSCFTQRQRRLKTLRIGAIFEHDSEIAIRSSIFELAVEEANRYLESYNIKLASEIRNSSNVVTSYQKVCELFESQDENGEGIAVLFANTKQSSSDMVASMCKRFTIPMIQSTPNLAPRSDIPYTMTVNVHPDIETLNQALLDFIDVFRWRNVAILYKGTEGLPGIKSVLNADFLQHRSSEDRIDTVFWEMKDINQTLKELRYNQPYKHIIVELRTHEIRAFLGAARGMGLLTSYHHYMFTSLDLGALNVSEFTTGGVNITGFRLVRPNTTMANHLTDLYEEHTETPDLEEEKKNHKDHSDNPLMLSHNSLIVDSVLFYSRALVDFFTTKSRRFSTQAFTCKYNVTQTNWLPGSDFHKEFSKVNFSGLTDNITLSNRRRLDVGLDLIEYDTDGTIQLVGRWTPNSNTTLGRLNITKSYEKWQRDIQKDMESKELRITVKVEPPFIMINTDKANLTGNARFKGFAVDMMKELAKGRSWTYRMELVPDEVTGTRLPNGSWSGMIGQLMTNKADLALGDLTINFERSKVIDFTKPFMNLGISILYKRPEPEPTRIFSFLQPLDNKIWMCMIGAYALVSLFLFLIARISPYEWDNPHPCNKDSDTLENQFTLLNCFWFTIGSLMQQGTEIAPRASSTRTIAGIWWFFTLILVSSYTANLAAFLTKTRMSTPISNADDLSLQTAIKYGCQYGGSTYSFFQDSKIPTYQKMWNFMSQNQDGFVNKSELGIVKVLAGKYAYLMESIPLRYQLSEHCDLMEIGGELDSKGYGIGVPKDSPYRDSLSDAILNLSESQVLLDLYKQWWPNPAKVCKLDEDQSKVDDTAKLGIKNLGGVFVILAAGLVLSMIMALVEFLINAMVNSKSDKQNLCHEIEDDCTFAFKCWGASEKPIKVLRIRGKDPSSMQRNHLHVIDDDLSRTSSDFN